MAQPVSRRGFLHAIGGCATFLSGSGLAQAELITPGLYTEDFDPEQVYQPLNDNGFEVQGLRVKRLSPKVLRRLVRLGRREAPGTIIVRTKEHAAYLLLEGGLAIRYGVAVGKAGLAFKGNALIGDKAEWPRWIPTKEMIQRSPKKYARYADGVDGGPTNPLGARALYLYVNGRDTYYRLHGTTDPGSIGRSVSNGCIRLFNQDIIDLYDRVEIGARVIVE
jgi:lipoprotein-anchoring transpeptidase ErfK/SrfK